MHGSEKGKEREKKANMRNSLAAGTYFRGHRMLK